MPWLGRSGLFLLSVVSRRSATPSKKRPVQVEMRDYLLKWFKGFSLLRLFELPVCFKSFRVWVFLCVSGLCEGFSVVVWGFGLRVVAVFLVLWFFGAFKLFKDLRRLEFKMFMFLKLCPLAVFKKIKNLCAKTWRTLSSESITFANKPCADLRSRALFCLETWGDDRFLLAAVSKTQVLKQCSKSFTICWWRVCALTVRSRTEGPPSPKTKKLSIEFVHKPKREKGPKRNYHCPNKLQNTYIT